MTVNAPRMTSSKYHCCGSDECRDPGGFERLWGGALSKLIIKNTQIGSKQQHAMADNKRSSSRRTNSSSFYSSLLRNAYLVLGDQARLRTGFTLLQDSPAVVLGFACKLWWSWHMLRGHLGSTYAHMLPLVPPGQSYNEVCMRLTVHQHCEQDMLGGIFSA